MSDINNVISQWIDRLADPKYPIAYKDALSDCIYELSSLVTTTIENEITAMEKDQQELYERLQESRQKTA